MGNTVENKVTPFVENVAESTAACLVTMVQGNLLLLGLSHWMLASQTGIIAGTAAATAIVLTKTDNRRIIAGILGLATAIVDYFVHPGMIGPVFIEAIVTGVGAAGLSYGVGSIVKRYRARRASAVQPGDSSV